MIHQTLVRLVHDHLDPIATRTIQTIQQDDHLGSVRRLPEWELRDWAKDVLRSLIDWPVQEDDRELSERYQALGRRRFQDSIPLQEAIRLPHRGHRVEVLERRPHVGDELVERREDPAVQRVPALAHPRRASLLRRVEPVQLGIGHQEGVDIPERDQTPAHLVGDREAEAQVLVRIAGGVEPAHHVRAHLLDRLFEPDRVAPAAVHRLALLVGEFLVALDDLVRRAAFQGHRHEHHGVEPEAYLLAHLGDQLRREPLLPVGAIVEVVER